jgi:hypothetical protein
LTTDTL